MRPGVRPTSPLDVVALGLNLAPRPVIDSMFSMIVARCVMAGVRLGVFARLARGPATADALAAELGLAPSGAGHLLECLVAAGHLRRRRGRFRLARRARRWLDPRSPRYVGNFIEFNYDQWAWWSEVEDAVRSGRSLEMHGAAAGDDYWRRYIRGQHDLAKLSGPEVARALELPPGARSLLDVAGAHGWFAAELCRRHTGLRATVLDLPGSARVGREIIAEAGLSERVRHVEGDALSADLGGPHDAALVFNLIHHLSPAQNVELLRRIAAALRPGGTLAVLDLFSAPAQERVDEAAFVGMHFWLTSGARTYTAADLSDWLGQAGLAPPRRVPIRSIPLQTLYEARRTDG